MIKLSTTILGYALCLCFQAASCLAQAPVSNGDGGPAVEAALSFPTGVAVDAAGNVYVAERRSSRIRRIDAGTGIITTVAGTGEAGYNGDGGPAAAAQIAHPELIALDASGNLLLTDRSNARIRRIDLTTGIITTVAGTGEAGYDGDGGPAAEAVLSYPFGVGLDRDGSILIADTENHVIRRIDAATGQVATVAGSGAEGYDGDGGPAVEARLSRPHSFAVDVAGNLLLGDSGNQRIRVVAAGTGRIETLYGTGEQGASPDGIHARDAAFGYFGAFLFDLDGDLVFTGWLDHRIRRIDRDTGIITTLAGTGAAGSGGDGGPATEAALNGPYGLATDQAGNLYVAEAEGNRVRRIDAETGVITTIAGRGR
jgi:streptogramin lyase